MAEVAGLVLGGLAVAIELVKAYKNLYRLYGRYRNCAREVEAFHDRLGIEQTKFCNEIHLLLSHFTNSSTANRILIGDNDHSSLEEMEAKWSSRLGDSAACCDGIMRNIQSRLNKMQRYLEASAPGESVRRRLKFFFHQSELSNDLIELKRLNDDFEQISGQINKMQDLQNRNLAISNFADSTLCVERFNAVREAAIQLFDALGHACKVHAEHWAHVQLEPQHIAGTEDDPPLIRFIMALTQDLIARGRADVDGVWIMIESLVNDASKSNAVQTQHGLPIQRSEGVKSAMSELKKSLKRVRDDPSPVPVKKLKPARVHFALPVTEQQVQSSKPAVNIQLIPKTKLLDFSRDHDLCKQIQRHLGTNCGLQSCIGYLGSNETRKHRIRPQRTIDKCHLENSMSLSNLVAQMSKRSYNNRMLPYESLKLARQLASAVLQFHATTLLKDSWRSDDVIFFGLDKDSTYTSLAPHLNVHVKEKAPGQNTLIGSNPERGLAGVVGNPYLFGLGIIFIELYSQAPFRSLREDKDLRNGNEDLDADFKAALRLSTTIGGRLGSTFPRIIRKCLFCDFGEGSRDLSELSLQRAFHRDVVYPLERLEASMKNFQIGA